MTSYAVTGSDASLVSRALSGLLEELGGGGLSELEEHEVGESSGDESREDDASVLGRVATALSTPSWLSERRLVVLRGAGELTAAEARELAKLVEDPPTENVLVLVSAGRALPQVLQKAVKAADGRLVETDPARGARARSEWIEDRIARSGAHLDAAARRRLVEHIGEDASRLDPILQLAAATYGNKAKVSLEEIEPLLGAEGAAPPWELTDAIDTGDGERAISALHRLLGPGERHPLQVMATLNRHVSAMLALDGAAVRKPEEAASLLKMSPYPARKVLEQSRKLGHDRIVRAVDVVATADADLRGRIGWPGELVMEVAVARLAQLSRSNARQQQTARGPSRRP